MSFLRSGLDVIRANWRAYAVINVVYYGLVIVGMVFVATQPELQRMLIGEVQAGFSSGPLAAVAEAYRSGQVLVAAALTFVVNFFLGTVLYITVPSLFIPFAGLLTGCVRALLWGLLLSPALPELSQPMGPHFVTLVLEGQGYILAMLGSYVLWATVFRREPQAGGFASRYGAGLGRSARLYLLVALVLAVAALYEAFEVIYLIGVSRS